MSCMNSTSKKLSIYVVIILLLLVDHYTCFTLWGTSSSDSNKKPSDFVIGIDLGNAYSRVGVLHNGSIVIIPNEQGTTLTPSYVAFADDGQILVGDLAKSQLTTNPEHTVFGIKRLLGKQWGDKDLQRDLKLFPFRVANNNGKPVIEVKTGLGKKLLSAEEITAILLGKLKENSERFLNQPVGRAVITVPVYFNEAQRQATKDAAAIAGLEVVRLLQEPTAAAVAYSLTNDPQKGRHILVVDVGDGSTSASVVEADEGFFQVVAISGENPIGSQDFVHQLMKHVIKVVEEKPGNRKAVLTKGDIQKIRREADRAIRLLSSDYEVKLEFETLLQSNPFEMSMSKAKFGELNIDLFETCLAQIRQIFNDFSQQKIDDVILTGGSTKILQLKDMFVSLLKGRKQQSFMYDADVAVAYGAAMVASQEFQQGPSPNPYNLLVIDIVPHSLGVETVGGKMKKIIPKNSLIPITRKDEFTTAQDNQVEIAIEVYEGESNFTKNNRHLGTIVLDRIPPAPAGNANVEVTFIVDKTGSLTVTAKDQVTGKADSAIFNFADKTRLSAENIKSMTKQYEILTGADRSAKERMLASYNLESLVWTVKAKLNDQISGNDDVHRIIADEIVWLEENKLAGLDELEHRFLALSNYVGQRLGIKNNTNNYSTSDKIDAGDKSEL